MARLSHFMFASLPGVLLSVSSAQNIERPLVVQQRNCAVPSTVQKLGLDYGQVTGVEVARGDCNGSANREPNGSPLVLTGLSVLDALDALQTYDDRYVSYDLSGVLTVRPRQSWTDPASPLNAKTSVPQFSGTAFEALVAVLRPLGFRLGTPGRQTPSADLSQRFAFALPEPVPLYEALNTVVRAHGRLQWTVQHCEAEQDIYVTLRSFDGHGVATAITVSGPNPPRGCG